MSVGRRSMWIISKGYWAFSCCLCRTHTYQSTKKASQAPFITLLYYVGKWKQKRIWTEHKLMAIPANLCSQIRWYGIIVIYSIASSQHRCGNKKRQKGLKCVTPKRTKLPGQPDRVEDQKDRKSNDYHAILYLSLFLAGSIVSVTCNTPPVGKTWFWGLFWCAGRMGTYAAA